MIIISDMLQNTDTCGWFEGQNQIPKYSKTEKSCLAYINKFQANVQPTKLYNGKTNVAVCLLPPIDGKKPKEGLLGFWHEFFQDALNHDFIGTCSPNEINERKLGLGQFK